MNKIKLFSIALASAACVSALSGCAEDKKARVAQRAVEKAHDPGACPANAEGHYRLQNQQPGLIIPSFLDVSRNTGNELTVQFDSKETYLVNGKEQPKTDGSKFSLGCAANGIRLAGTDAKGQRTELSLVPTKEGMDVQQKEPTKMTSKYEKTSALGTVIDKVTKPLDQTPDASGIPSPDTTKKN
jgi:hypothetical protein